MGNNVSEEMFDGDDYQSSLNRGGAYWNAFHYCCARIELFCVT